MILAHKIRLYANNKQFTYFCKACGVARFAYNWGLTEWQRRYEAGEPVNEQIIRKALNAIKHKEFPWMSEVSKCAPQLAIKNGLKSAFANFFRGQKEGKDIGYPKYRKKGRDESFTLSNDHFEVKGKKVRIPKLGWVKLAEELRFKGRIIEATISKEANNFFISISVELDEPIKRETIQKTVGVDLGVKNLATLSDGVVIEGVKASKKNEKRIKRLNQKLARQKGAKKGEEKSKNFLKTQRKLRKVHLQIADIRKDYTHKLTHMITTNYSVIGMEDLDIAQMLSNSNLAFSLQDVNLYEVRRQVEYKAEMSSAKVVVAPRYFASSKICSKCGTKKEDLKLSERKWICSNCGTTHDRDINAAINLKNYAIENNK